MRAFITGGAGFIGSHLADALIARGDSVTILDNLSTGSKKNIAHLEGKARYGLGQMSPGTSTTRAAVIDFDDHAGTLPAGALAQATRAVADALELLGFHPTIWTSGGGVGAHRGPRRRVDRPVPGQGRRARPVRGLRRRAA